MRRASSGLAAFILVAMIGLGAANLVRVERSGDAETAIIGGAANDVAQPDGPLTIEAAFVMADARATAWSADATLTFASLQADWPLDPQEPGPAALPPGGWARFAFVNGAGDHLLSVVIERYSGGIVTAESQPWAGSRTGELPITATTISSETAVVIAESGYGQAWRLRCPVQRHETDVTLLSGAPTGSPGSHPAEMGSPAATPAVPATVVGSPIAAAGTPFAAIPTIGPAADAGSVATDTASGLRWLVTYRDGTQPGLNSVAMEIDATSGQILFIDDRSQVCSDLSG